VAKGEETCRHGSKNTTAKRMNESKCEMNE
jgi:hypothetical protein